MVKRKDALIIPKNKELQDSSASEPLLHLISLLSPPSFSKCMRIILSLTIPSAAFTIMQASMLGINLHQISELGDEQKVAGLGLGQVWLIATVFGTILSLNTGTTVLAAQALGALNHGLVPLYFYRALVLRAIQAAACYIICVCSVWIFELLDFSDAVSNAASECCTFSFLAIIGLTVYDTLKAYVNAHTTFLPIMIIEVFVLITHWFYCKLFVSTFGLGIKGAILSFGVSQLTGSGILFVYVLMRPKFKKTRRWPTKSALNGLWCQFVNEFYICSFFVFQLIALTICVLMGGKFSLDQTVSQTSIYNISMLVFAPILSLSETAMILIGNSLGRKEALRARNLSKALLTTALLFLVVEMSLLYFLGTMSILMVYIWIMPGDFIQITITSILRGAMRERIGALISFISFYVIGVTGAFVFGVVLKWNAKGIWAGIGIGIYLMLVLAGFLLWKTDYESQIRKIDDRLVIDDIANPDKSIVSTRKDLNVSSYLSDNSIIRK